MADDVRSQVADALASIVDALDAIKPADLASAIEDEYVRQMGARASSIPVKTGASRDALTSKASAAREVIVDGDTVQIAVSTPGVAYRRSTVPTIDEDGIADAVAAEIARRLEEG